MTEEETKMTEEQIFKILQERHEDLQTYALGSTAKDIWLHRADELRVVCNRLTGRDLAKTQENKA